MKTGFCYPLWNGKKIVGHYYSPDPIWGDFIEFPEISILKQPYVLKPKSIKVPIYRSWSDDGMVIKATRMLDVRKKSNRQIAIILSLRGHF